MHQFRPLVCLWCTSKLSNFAKFHVYSPWILHLSSNRREQNSAPPFQFVTPGRELIQKSTNFQQFLPPKVMNFWNHSIIRNLRPENLQRSTQKDTNFQQMHSLIPINCHQQGKCLSEFCTIHAMHPLSRPFVALVLSRPYLKFNQMHSMTPCFTTSLKPTPLTYWEHLLTHPFILQTNCDKFW